MIWGWQATLFQCGQALSQLLKDYHSGTIDFHSDQVDTILSDLGDLVDNFNPTIPDFADWVEQIIMEIRAQADWIIASRSTIMKRAHKDDSQQPGHKKPKKIANPWGWKKTKPILPPLPQGPLKYTRKQRERFNKHKYNKADIHDNSKCTRHNCIVWYVLMII